MTDSAHQHLDRFVGTWTTEATHPQMPGVVVHGTATFEWLEGEHFLIQRARTDHEDFPDSIAIIGITGTDRVDPRNTGDAEARLRMSYFDSRGVSRVYDVGVDDTTLRFSRMASGFSQRFVGTLANNGDTLAGRWQLCEDDKNWRDDLEITYRRNV